MSTDNTAIRRHETIETLSMTLICLVAALVCGALYPSSFFGIGISVGGCLAIVTEGVVRLIHHRMTESEND